MGCCNTCNDFPDVLRVATYLNDNTAGGAPAAVDVQLDENARVYGLKLIGGTLKLQDSALVAADPANPVTFDTPGLVWPAHAQLVAAAGASATLHLIYGACKS